MHVLAIIKDKSCGSHCIFGRCETSARINCRKSHVALRNGGFLTASATKFPAILQTSHDKPTRVNGTGLLYNTSSGHVRRSPRHATCTKHGSLCQEPHAAHVAMPCPGVKRAQSDATALPKADWYPLELSYHYAWSACDVFASPSGLRKNPNIASLGFCFPYRSSHLMSVLKTSVSNRSTELASGPQVQLARYIEIGTGHCYEV